MLIRDWEDKWPFSEHVLKYNYMLVTTLSAGQIHYIHTNLLKWLLNRDGLERWSVLTASSRDHSTIRAPLTVGEHIIVHAWPPPLSGQSTVELGACKMASIDTTKEIGSCFGEVERNVFVHLYVGRHDWW